MGLNVWQWLLQVGVAIGCGVGVAIGNGMSCIGSINSAGGRLLKVGVWWVRRVGGNHL
jgi:hypothetical protein